MSPNILLIVKEHLENNLKINPKRVEIFLSFFEKLEKGKLIYPNMVKSKLVLSYPETYKILDSLEEIEILQYAFQVYCHKCNKYQEMRIMDSLNEFPDDAYCENNHKLNPSKDVVVMYKVKRDE